MKTTLVVWILRMLHMVVAPALTICIQDAFGQGTLIHGLVTDDDGQEPVVFTSVSILRDLDSTSVSVAISDAKGVFEIADVPSGSYHLRIQLAGYKTRHVTGITIRNEKVFDVGNIRLIPSKKLLNEIVLSANKPTVLYQAGKQTYTASNFSSALGGTAVDVLKNLPSLSVNGEGELTFRGSPGFIILLDGKAAQADPMVILDQLPANSIDRIEVITTPSSQYDPDGKSGILNIITKKGATDGYSVAVNLQQGLPSIEDYDNVRKPIRFGGDITSTLKQGPWNISLNANYKRDDQAGYREGKAETFIGNRHTTFPSIGERSYRNISYGMRGVVTYQLNKKSSLEAGFYAGKRTQYRRADITYFQKRFEGAEDVEINSFEYFNKNLRERKGDFIVVNLDYKYVFKNRATLALSSLYEKTILGGPTRNTNVDPLDNRKVFNDAYMKEANPLDGARFKADYTLPLSDNLRFEGGYQYRYLLHKGDFEYEQLNTETNTWYLRRDLSNAISMRRHIHAVYGQVAGQLSKLVYSGGLRMEYVDRELKDEGRPEPYRFERLNLFPSANLQYSLTGTLRIKAGYSRRISHNTSNMMNPFPARRHSEVFEIGDPNLMPEYIEVSELGVMKDIADNSLFLSFYHRHTKNVINRVNTVYNDTILWRTYTNAGSANAWGVEAGFDLKPLDWWTFYAGINVYNYSIDGSVFNNSVGTSGINSSWNANTNIQVGPSFSIQCTVNYTSRTVTAQGEDSRFLIPSLALKKTVLRGRGTVTLQWQNIDIGDWGSNQQQMATAGADFYTSTNYIYEVNVVRVNMAYTFNKVSRKISFTESEFGEKEF